MSTTKPRGPLGDEGAPHRTARNRLLREIERQERTAHTRAANSLRRTRRQLAAVEHGRPIADWIDIQLA